MKPDEELAITPACEAESRCPSIMEVSAMAYPNRVELARFFSKVEVASSGCWRWTAATNPNGYGVFGDGGAGRSAHRVAYEWFVGSVVAHEQVDHLCRNRACVNPAHLEAVIPTENVRRSTWWPEAEAVVLDAMHRPPTHPGEAFEEEYRKPSNISQAEAARRMGMSTNRLNEIVAGKRSVTAETAVLFGAVTGTDPRMWLAMQVDYDLWHALRETDTSKVTTLGADVARSARTR
jgi:addiction module HigA family antidote